jgi:cytochrome c556
MPKHLTLLLSVATLLAAGSAAAQPTATDAVEFRQAVMNVYAWNVNRMRDMVRGDVPFDAAAFQSHAADLAAAANMDVAKGFPEDSITDESDARDEIWLNWDGFLTARDAMKDAAGKLAEAAASGDEAAMKEQFGAVGRTCKGCHDDFRN